MRTKICGITQFSDAQACVDLGADAIGLNFWKGSPRYCDDTPAIQIATHLRDKVLLVGIFVNADIKMVQDAITRYHLGCVQFHGDETPEYLERFLPHAYKALPVRDDSIVDEANRFGGRFILLDAHLHDQRGGTGVRADWALCKRVAQERDVVLAGGLNPENVAAAIETVRPWCVDVASGVEASPGVKDLDAVARFIRAARVPPQ